MLFSLSTHWNACRHESGEAMIEEIRAAGFDHVELGYDLRLDLVPGVQKMADEKTVTVDSVHNFCPVPVGAPRGHPEIFELASTDRRMRASAVLHTTDTIRFAAGIGAKTVVVHAGNADMKHMTGDLVELCEDGRQYDSTYEKIKLRLLMQRDKHGPAHVDALCSSLEELLPALQAANVRLAVENLPSWESIPTEAEMEKILARFDSPLICCWHDIGHGQVRQNLGFISARLWLEKLKPRLAGFHIHDVLPPARDHLMPPRGQVDFAAFKTCAESGIALVFEPAPETPVSEIQDGVKAIREAWEDQPRKGGQT